MLLLLALKGPVWNPDLLHQLLAPMVAGMHRLLVLTRVVDQSLT